jgi:hypothetical protein
MTKKILASILAGSCLGVLGARYLFVGSWLSLVPWTIVGLGFGVWAQHKQWRILGALYGFFLFLVFTIAGYSGTASVSSRVPFFLIIGIVGSIFGFVTGWLGSVIRKKISSSNGGHTV